MAALHPELRKQFEKTILQARKFAESGAKASLARLAVEEKEAFGQLSPQEKTLRVKLRAHARQLGDKLDALTGRQSIAKLTHEVAYEHWHRMLFARFLAENRLLIHPDLKVAVTLRECKELAEDEAAGTGEKPDAWLVASRFAARMLPQIFRPDDPALAVALAPEHQLTLEKLLEEIPADVFAADDSLGWVYQFWQKEEKDRVNRAGDKITADTLPAVTQLFTEHYMVLFLLHNTIGAWHAGKVLAANLKLAEASANEDELRRAVAVDGYTFDYLRFIRTADGKGPWAPAAGTFSGWPRAAAELKLLDPCCGSGHFLVAAFELLTRLRMKEEGIDSRTAADVVVRDNLFGLEIDPRCTQIAAFNLALAAWKADGFRVLPPLNIACTGIAPQGKKEQWLNLSEGLPLRERGPMRLALDALYEAFKDAPTLGSLIDPADSPRPAGAAGFDDLTPLLAAAAKIETGDEGNGALDQHADAVTAHGLVKAAELLVGPNAGYTLVITNVPYLGRKSHGEVLRRFIDDNYAEARKDLATAFIDRALRWLSRSGTAAIVTRENWLFLSGYRAFRTRLLKDQSWDIVARLGPGGFETISGHVVKTSLVALSMAPASPGHEVAGFEASGVSTPSQKASVLRGLNLASFSGEYGAGDTGDEDEEADGGSDEPSGPADGIVRVLRQSDQLENPESRIVLDSRDSHDLLQKWANSWQGIKTSDDPRFTQQFWEQARVDRGWYLYQRTPECHDHYAGRSEILFWEDGNGQLTEVCQRGAPFRGQSGWGRSGVAVHTMGDLTPVIYTGERFSADVSIVDPKDQADLLPIYVFLSSEQYPREVRKIDRALRVTNTALVQVPFDLPHWKSVAAQQYPQGLPEPESDLPTQWLFHGRPEASASPIQVGVGRLVGYRWPAELDQTMRLSARAAELAKKCEILRDLSDDDGIVPIPAVGREEPAAERARALLAAAYGSEWSAGKLHQLLADPKVDWAEKGLEDWLRNGFFEQHCALFHQRPFVWHIWDGHKTGFAALVNYHRLADGEEGAKLLEKLTYNYLGDWITRQSDEAKKGTAGADSRLAAAKDLQAKLKLIAQGEAPYDIFVRWKPLEQHPIGWRPDLNDGVRLNIRPFVTAGVLRKNPKIHWNKDRGKDPESAPWYKVFKGERINDHHLTLDEKRAARAAAVAETATATVGGRT